ncbi:MAG: class I SAM-dependent methyltransferase [Pirellulales bacterium]
MHTEQFELHARIEERHWWFVARRSILRQVINAVLPPGQGAPIVDVGCGTGANIAALADEYDCTGIDTSQEAVRLAAERFPQVRFLCGQAEQMPSILESARLVLLCDVLEHVPDDFRLLSELLAVTQPGTYFLLTVPADMTLWSEHDRSFGHYRRYEPARFAQLWQGLPVTTRFVSPFNARLYPLVKTVRGWNRWRGKALGAAGTDFVLPSAPINAALRRCFAGEGRRLAALARGRSRRPYRHGVSLMALVERGEGLIEPRRRPDFVAHDIYGPADTHPLEELAV